MIDAVLTVWRFRKRRHRMPGPAGRWSGDYFDMTDTTVCAAPAKVDALSQAGTIDWLGVVAHLWTTPKSLAAYEARLKPSVPMAVDSDGSSISRFIGCFSGGTDRCRRPSGPNYRSGRRRSRLRGPAPDKPQISATAALERCRRPFNQKPPCKPGSQVRALPGAPSRRLNSRSSSTPTWSSPCAYAHAICERRQR